MGRAAIIKCSEPSVSKGKSFIIYLGKGKLDSDIKGTIDIKMYQVIGSLW